MEKLTVDILVQKDSKLGNNKFVLGKITGFVESTAVTIKDYNKGTLSWRWLETGLGYIIRVKTTVEEYVSLKTMIEDHYPGLCKFGIFDVECWRIKLNGELRSEMT